MTAEGAYQTVAMSGDRHEPWRPGTYREGGIPGDLSGRQSSDERSGMSGNRHVFGWRWADYPRVWPVLRWLCRVGLHNVSCRGRRDHL